MHIPEYIPSACNPPSPDIDYALLFNHSPPATSHVPGKHSLTVDPISHTTDDVGDNSAWV